ncbi:MAG TPA: acyltransferase domain-containing protein, partial [Phycisphaerales bacterium]|nr:acyltransferase domain-containing protein [Phycisphaerales bacterium]
MADSLVLLCPGQGAQKAGMGKAWFDASPAAQAIFEEADVILGGTLGLPLSEICSAFSSGISVENASSS